jgi:hypothetical protein
MKHEAHSNPSNDLLGNIDIRNEEDLKWVKMKVEKLQNKFKCSVCNENEK